MTLSLDAEQVAACNQRIDTATERLNDIEGTGYPIIRDAVIDIAATVQDVLAVLAEIVNSEETP